MKRNVKVGLMGVIAVGALAFVAPAHATSGYNSSFRTTYPAAAGSRIDSCNLCHTASIPSLNPYGSAYRAANHNFNSIASADSDGDTFINSVEIAGFFFPGNAADRPAPAADTTAPVVSVFSIPATSASLTVPISTLTATDAVGVTGYLVNQSATKPAAGAAGWTTTRPASYTFAAAGAQTLFAYAKDLAGNVSNGVAASVTITLPPAPDTTAPVVSVFAIPPTSASLTVPITTLTATDAVGVTGYLVNQSATKPAAGAAGWTAAKPASYTFAAAGAQTLYAYAKDLAGNVSNGAAASVTITLPPPVDTTAPTVSAFSVPPTSTSLTVPISGITAIDNVGVTGFLVNESATKPAAGAPGWSLSAPASYTFASASTHTLYAYAKDLAGNVSNGATASVTITLPPPVDTTAPTVSVFSVPPTSTSLTVPVLAFTAGDDTAVTGYLITESATKPAAGAAAWRSSAPASYTAATDGTHTLYAYARDAAGNVSDGLSGTVTITLAPATGPLFSDSFADATTDGDPNWERVAGKFVGQRGAFASVSRTDNLALVRDVIDLDPYLGGRIETDLRLSDPYEDTRAGVVFDYQDAGHYRYVLFNIKRRTITVGEVNASDGDDDDDVDDEDDSRTERTRRIIVRSTPGGWHHLKVDVDSATGLVSVYLDAAAQPVIAMTFPSVGQGRVGILAERARLKAAFDNFKVRDASVLP